MPPIRCVNCLHYKGRFLKRRGSVRRSYMFFPLSFYKVEELPSEYPHDDQFLKN